VSSEETRYEAELKAARDQRSTVVLVLKFSPDGEFLLCASKQGKINVFKATFRSAAAALQAAPLVVFSAHKGPIYALEFVSGVHFITGGDEELRAWDLKALLARPETVAPLFELVPKQTAGPRGATLPRGETNGLAFDSTTGVLYSACGDNNVYAWDLSKRALLGTFSGHTDAVYAVALAAGGRLLSASEDGTVRVWDSKTAKSVGVLDPTSLTAFDEKTFAGGSAAAAKRSWIDCMAVDPTGNWMVCGGGNKCLSLWNVPSLTATAAMPSPGTPQCVLFDGDRVIAVGNESYVYHWKPTGKLTYRTRSSSTSLFAAAAWKASGAGSASADPLVVVAGNSAYIDFYLTPSVASFRLAFRS